MVVVKTLASIALVVTLLIGTHHPATAADEETSPNDDLWYPVAADDSPQVGFYFVYSETCGHCAKAEPFIDQLETEHDWLLVTRVSSQAATDEEIDVVVDLAAELGQSITGVPTYLFCESMDVGFHTEETTGVRLEDALIACHQRLVEAAGGGGDIDSAVDEELADSGSSDLNVPVLGDIDADAVSLPLFTVAIAGLDAFNPCAFFVLLFLLSLLVHAKSRWRMAAVGGVFVVISGIMYFAFMAAWLNVFLVTGQLRWVTTVAGGIALVLAIMNMKDYFFPDTAGTLSIPDSAKPGLFARMRKLTAGDSMPAVLAGTIALAAVANSYELLCTAGFPMVFTRVLTLNELSTPTYYGYLALYNVIYVVPLLIIVGVFVKTLGSRKLSENEGRFLKLMSGTMMLGLGLLLLVRPDLLENMFAAVGIMAIALTASVAVSAIQVRRKRLAAP